MTAPEDPPMTDAQLFRAMSLAIAALSGINSTVAGLIRSAKLIDRYIATGEGVVES